MDMIDLKRDDKEDSADGKDCCMSMYEQDAYPVQIYLDDDTLEKLGLSSLEVGKEMIIHAKVKVRSFSSRETKEGTEKDASLTVMAMAVDTSSGSRSAANVIYGAKDGD